MRLPISVAVIGLGKIATEQHVPSIKSSSSFSLVATVDPARTESRFNHVRELAESSDVIVDAVSVCTPPQERFEIARLAIQQGWHVLLEKPPCSTIGEVEHLHRLAVHNKVTLMTAWHSKYGVGVVAARQWLASCTMSSVRVSWKEDWRKWHPSQEWLWKAGGFGVFDSGVNALSVLSAIIPGGDELVLRDADLYYHSGKETPVSARLSMCDSRGAPLLVLLDAVHTGKEEWIIEVETDTGKLRLSAEKMLEINGERIETEHVSEYSQVYAEFAKLILDGESAVDVVPLALVANAMMIGRKHCLLV